MERAVLVLKGVTKEYRQGKLSVSALRGIDFTVSKGDFLSIAGPSGSGKTTLLNLMGCLDVPTQGSIMLEGQELAKQTKQQLAEIRRHRLGFIFQSYNLIPVLTAFENVAFPLELLGELSREEINSRVEEMLAEVGLSQYGHHRPNELSGGQQQRVAIARALVKDPALVLADEPTANLDSENGRAILEIMWKLNQEKGTTFVFSTHDPMVMEYATRLVTLRDGQIVEDRRRE
ncbi:MAG: ABC transporter ATP-binding protein [Limnochordia bacterium]